jgi:hypothetical protein
MKKLSRFALLSAALVLTACANKAEPSAAQATWPPDIQTADECTKAGGTWGRVGLLGTEACTLPSPDAGKQCSDSSECAGQCWSSDAPGQPGKGMCQPTNMPFGCHSEVLNGVVQPALCAD